MPLEFSRRLAITAGLALPLLETWRRWDQLSEPVMWLAWLDDWAIAAFLLWGAWRTRQDIRAGRHILAAAWGFACGLAYASFVASLLSTSAVDASGASRVTAVTVKAGMLTLAVAALIATLSYRPSSSQRGAGSE